MPDLGIEVLLKGNNLMRLLAGLGVALKISLIAIGLSILLGILIGMLVNGKNPIIKGIYRVYLEFIRIMPQLVLLFLVYFWLGFIRRNGSYFCIYPMGNGRNE